MLGRSRSGPSYSSAAGLAPLARNGTVKGFPAAGPPTPREVAPRPAAPRQLQGAGGPQRCAERQVSGLQLPAVEPLRRRFREA